MAKVTPAAPAVKNSAKPQGADDKKPKRESTRDPKAIFGLIGSKDPNVYPFQGTWEGEGDARKLTRATPSGFDPEKHESLGKKDFAKPSIYLTHRAELLEAKAAKFRSDADTVRAGGDKKGGTGKANRLLKAMKRAEEIRKELEAAGVNVDALLAKARESEAATPAPKEAAVSKR
jgi:hypothetical protein